MQDVIDTTMQQCIDNCLACYQTCLDAAMNHCLDMGGAHVEKEHFTLMIACTEMCRVSAHFMLIRSPAHRAMCVQCAELCENCAADCERLGDMDECAEACRTCADSCRAMAA
jgi:hypothetical protein